MMVPHVASDTGEHLLLIAFVAIAYWYIGLLDGLFVISCQGGRPTSYRSSVELWYQM